VPVSEFVYFGLLPNVSKDVDKPELGFRFFYLILFSQSQHPRYIASLQTTSKSSLHVKSTPQSEQQFPCPSPCPHPLPLPSLKRPLQNSLYPKAPTMRKIVEATIPLFIKPSSPITPPRVANSPPSSTSAAVQALLLERSHLISSRLSVLIRLMV
jgi:hypothetical protein